MAEVSVPALPNLSGAQEALQCHAESQLTLTERLRIEAARKLAHDSELDEIESELRRDLHARGVSLSWDTTQLGMQKVLPTAAAPLPVCGDAEGPEAAAAQPAAVEASPPADTEQRRRSASSIFGDDDNEETARPSFTRLAELGWHLESQRSWQQGDEWCTLSMLENRDQQLLRFELLEHRTAEKCLVTCTQEKFDELCERQSGSSHQVRVDGAIKDLFRQATEETLQPDKASVPPLAEKDSKNTLDVPPRQHSARESDVGDFGEDDEDPKTGDPEWRVESQQTWKQGEEQCTLTICQHKREGLLRFELREHRTADICRIECTGEKFDELCNKQTTLAQASQRVNAAIKELFRQAAEEAKAEVPKSAREIEDFGEDDDNVEAEATDSLWRVESQRSWQQDEEYCTLTICENRSEKLIRFELMEHRTAETCRIEITNEKFDELCGQQTGLSGPAQVNAAIKELFRQAAEDKEPLSGRSSKVDLNRKSVDLDDGFGEDEDDAAGPPGWRVDSQRSWSQGDERCTLTVFENQGEGLFRFELLEHRTAETCIVTCTREKFDELCSQQVGSTSQLKVNEAIKALFRQATMEELPDVSGLLESNGTEQVPAKATPPASARTNLSKAASELSDFGAGDESARGGDPAWHVESQRSWMQGDEQCSLTISENKLQGLLRFELKEQRSGETCTVTCTKEQFDQLCDDQTGPSSQAKVDAAIRAVFSKATATDDSAEATSPTDAPPAQPKRDLDPPPAPQRSHTVSTFGDDEEEADPGESIWRQQSVRQWKQGEDECKMTISENREEGMLRFELVEQTSKESCCVQIAKEIFDELAAEQGGASERAKVDAAVKELFRKVTAAQDAPPNSPARAASPAGSTQSPEVDEFGEEEDQKVSADPLWRVESERKWHQGEDECKLTVYENKLEANLRFELVEQHSSETCSITISKESFDALVAEQTGASEAVKVDAAIKEVFRRATEASEAPESAASGA